MDQTSCLKISCNASKTLPRPRPGSISRAAASSCLSWSWKTRLHITGPKPSSSPEQTGQLTESQTEMALLLQGKSWTDTGEHRFALEAGPLRLRRAFCGVEREGESFFLRVNALSRNNALPADAEAELEALCADTVRRCWTLGLDISEFGAHQALRDGHFALTTKNVCPEIRADVKLMKC